MSQVDSYKLPVLMGPVLIGPVSDDPAESVSSVNKALIGGLSDRHNFVAPSANRVHGKTRQARLNLWNLYYLAKHTAVWLWAVLRHRPTIAHYGITTGWALAKGLLFLRLARACGARSVAHLHCGAFTDYWNGLSVRRKGSLTRQFAKIDAFIVLSEYWRRTVAQCVPILDGKLFVVSNPIDTIFENIALQMTVKRAGNVILSIGVMGRDKGVLDIVEATARVRKECPAFELILAGPEREPSILDEVRRGLRANFSDQCVTFHAGVWGEAKVELFRKASILLLPSYFENFPLVVLEAAAAGQAIITTPVGAIPEFFKDGHSAIFIEPGNPEQLAQAMIRLLRDPQECCRMGLSAREVFERRLGRSGIMDSLADVYARVLHQSLPLPTPSGVKSVDAAVNAAPDP